MDNYCPFCGKILPAFQLQRHMEHCEERPVVPTHYWTTVTRSTTTPYDEHTTLFAALVAAGQQRDGGAP